MSIEKFKTEFGPKDYITYGMVAVTLLFGGFKLDSLVRTTADGVEALSAIVDNHDGRIERLEADKLAADNFEAGYEKALEEMGSE